MNKNPLLFFANICFFVLIPQVSYSQWVQTASPGTGGTITVLLVNKNYLFAGVQGDGIYRSMDNGTSWQSSDSGIDSAAISTALSYTQLGNSIFLGTYGHGIYVSANNGTTWKEINTGLINKYILSIKSNGTFIFAGTSSGVFVSADTGRTWFLRNDGLAPADTNVNTLVIGNGKIFALMHHSVGFRIYSTSSSEQFWDSTAILAVSGPGYSTASAFAAIGNDILVSYFWEENMAKIPAGIFHSTDNGSTFTTINTGFPSVPVATDFTNYGNTVFVGTNYGVFVSSDDKFNWAGINSGLPCPSPSSFIQHLTVNESYLFASIESGGLWRIPLSEVAVKTTATISNQIGPGISIRYSPDQYVIVSFSISRAERITIKVFDASGREIATIEDKKFEKDAHNLLWDTRKLAPGCYIVKLQAGTNTYMRSFAVFR